MGSLWLLWLPPTVQKPGSDVSSIGDSKLPKGVNVSKNGCLYLYFSTVTEWQPVQGVPWLLPFCSLAK